MEKKQPFYIRLRPDLMSDLRLEAKRQGVAMTEIIEAALDAQFGPLRGSVVNLEDHMPEDKDGL